MKKKIFAALFLVIFIFAAGLFFNGNVTQNITVTAQALTEGNFTYEVSNGEATITDYPESATGEVVIPDTLGGYPVTGIGGYAFCNCTGLTSIEIPDKVTYIGDSAFSGCSNLKTINIPRNLTEIRSGNFDGFSYSGMFKDCISLKNIIIPNDSKLTLIGTWAFYNCTGLTSIEIPDTVTVIGGAAFKNCTGLTSIKIVNDTTRIWDDAFYNTAYYNNAENWTDNVLYIDNFLIKANSGAYKIKDGTKVIAAYAFSDCTELKSIEIPDSVTSIGASAFSGCYSLESITIPFVGAKQFSATDTYQYPFGYIFGISYYTGEVNTTQYYYDSSTNSTTNSPYYIPSSLKTVTVTGGYIPYGAFYNCTGLTSIQIGDSVTTISDRAFYNCTGLTSIELPDSVTSIGSSAFSGCSGLTSIEIPDRVTSIGSSAFSGCYGLTSIEIPDSVTSIGDRAFYNCRKLENIAVSNKNVVYHSSGNCLIESKSKTLVLGCKNSVIPNDNTVTSIGVGAFTYCTGLTSIEIPDSVTSIGDSTFSGCSSLKEVTFKNKETEIPFNDTTIPVSTVINCLHNSTAYKYALSFNREYVLTDEHHYNLKLSLPASCASYGFNMYECDCGAEKNETIIPTGHTEAVDKAVAATCTTTGLTEGKHCSVCKAVLIEQKEEKALGHDWGEWKADNNGNHTRICKNDANHTETVVCSDAEPVVTPATCTTDSFTTYTCDVCGYVWVVTDENTALGHDIVKHEAKPATCTEIGWDAYNTCSRCDYTTYKEIPAKGHTEAVDKAVAATCTKTGLTEGKHCSVCKAVLVAQKEVKALGHDYTAQVQTKDYLKTAATCTGKAVYYYKCSRCTAKGTNTYTFGNALGHKAVSVAAKAATTTATGNNAYYKCSVCEKLFSDKACTKETTLAAVTIPVIEPTFTYGDIDKDGKITAADARLALRASVGLEKYSADSDNYNACDVDTDGKITAADARLILRASVGLEDEKKFGKK